MHAELLTFWRTIAISFAFDSTQTIDSFNRDINQDILYWEHLDPDLAVQLVLVKLDVNRRFHWMSHAS